MSKYLCQHCAAFVEFEIKKLRQQLESQNKKLKEALRILERFDEYRNASDRKETSKTDWHTYERILYDTCKAFLQKHTILNNEE